MWQTKLSAYIRLTRLDKPIGIYLLLWPTVWALILASSGFPSMHMLIVFCSGVVLMRSAGCVINDYADRHVDGKVKRTAMRPLVSGDVSEKEAIGLFTVLLFLSFLLVLTLNSATILLSLGAVLLASTYPFMKRYTHLPQVVLGAAFSWGIPMAFMAIMGTLPWWSWLLYAANLVWTVAYDTQYAMVDRDDDVKIGVKSTAILFGRWDKLIIAILQGLTLFLLIVMASVVHLGWPFYVAILIVSGIFLYQQWLISERARDKCFQAFLNNHIAGLVITLGLAGHYVLNA